MIKSLEKKNTIPQVNKWLLCILLEWRSEAEKGQCFLLILIVVGHFL